MTPNDFGVEQQLAEEIEADLRDHPGAVAIIFSLDEVTVWAFTPWLTRHKDKLLEVRDDFSRGPITFARGMYRIAKSKIFAWPENGPPLICPMLYIRVDEPRDENTLALDQLLAQRIAEEPDSIWTWWVCSEAEHIAAQEMEDEHH